MYTAERKKRKKYVVTCRLYRILMDFQGLNGDINRKGKLLLMVVIALIRKFVNQSSRGRRQLD